MVEQLTQSLSGRYRIERELGQGGMATVYLARDVRHDRMVALKVMRPELLAVIGAQRFLGEIKTTASLQHPHILALHDSGEVNGTVFYVMPYVEGESLRDRLNRERQLPVDDAVRIAREVAGALDYAHRRGVIHRDIKPENVLLHEGQALVADFGIALAVSRIEGGTRMTETGMSLGTPHYMAPEQAMGDRSVDARADVYALGCVLYETLTGEPPFTGPTAQAIVARVLTDTPRSLRAQRQTIPPHVEAAVHKALQKLPADRFASAADFATALGDSSFRTGAALPAAGAERARSGLGAVAAGVTIAALGVLAAWGWLRNVKPHTTWTYLSHPAGEEGRFQFGSFALAPDGQSYVYMGPGEGGTPQLWLKKRSELHGTALRGTSGALGPFFSPDGEWLAFFAGGKLMKMPASGGAPAPLAPAVASAPWGVWLPNNRIVFGNIGYAMSEVDGAGGSVRQLSALQDLPAYGAVAPVALPVSNGDFVFVACTVACAARQMWAYDADAGQSHLLLPDAFPLGFAEGHLLYGYSGSIFAAPFDLDQLKVTGPGIPVLDNVLMSHLAPNGTLLYVEGSGVGQNRVEIVTRDGVGTLLDSAWVGNFSHVAVSRDGKHIAVDQADGDQQAIWIRASAGGTVSRLTFDGKANMRPAWSPDDARIAWVAPEDSTSTILVKRADGVGPTTRLITSKLAWEVEWSPEGEWIIYRQYAAMDGDDIYAVRTSGDTTPIPIVRSRFYDRAPTISPDNRYIAYASNESGRDEIYVRPFPGADDNRWVISVGGGTEPRWSRDGRELFYISADNVLHSAPVTLGDSFGHRQPRPLFSVRTYAREYNSRAYDVMPDGRFVMLRGAASTAGAPVLVENWVADLRRKIRK